jgi:hypothetical protein
MPLSKNEVAEKSAAFFLRGSSRFLCAPFAVLSSCMTELNIVSKHFLLEHRAFIPNSRIAQSECVMNIFYLIGVVVVIIVVAGFLGLHV